MLKTRHSQGNHARNHALSHLIALAALAATLCGVVCAQVLPVTVDKVETPTGPPSNMSLRLSGQHMDNVVRVSTKHKGIHVIRMESPDANHLVVWLRMAAGTEPGTMMLQVSSRDMTTFVAVPMIAQSDSSVRGELSASQ